MIHALISAVLQVLVFSLIPFLVYLIRYKKARGFFDYIGLKRSTRKANLLALLLMLFLAAPLVLLSVFNEGFREIMTDPKSVSGAIRQMGFGLEAIVIILLTAIVKTGLAEEIFFRGFVAKRLIAITNFPIGNWIQAILFGLLHALLFLGLTDNVLFLVMIFVFPTLGAYFKTYLNEKLANGSIVPGWIAHGLGNVVAYSTVLFL